jgi:hypothetical protein
MAMTTTRNQSKLLLPSKREVLGVDEEQRLEGLRVKLERQKHLTPYNAAHNAESCGTLVSMTEHLLLVTLLSLTTPYSANT